MKLTNFQYLTTRRVKDNLGFTDEYQYATVDIVTSAFWPFRKAKVETKEVFRKFPLSWQFSDNGRYCPGFIVEGMHAAWKAKEVLNETKQTPR